MSYVSPAEVREWADLKNATDTSLQVVIDAVEAKLPQRYVEYTVADGAATVLKPDVHVAMMMQVSRLWGRKKTKDGISQTVDDGAGGVVFRVNRFDPDIDDLLGDYRKAPFAAV